MLISVIDLTVFLLANCCIFCTLFEERLISIVIILVLLLCLCFEIPLQRAGACKSMITAFIKCFEYL